MADIEVPDVDVPTNTPSDSKDIPEGGASYYPRPKYNGREILNENIIDYDSISDTPLPLKETKLIRKYSGEYSLLGLNPIIDIFAPDFDQEYLDYFKSLSNMSNTRASKGWCRNSAGKIIEVANDTLRLHYDSRGRCLGFLCEPQSTNLAKGDQLLNKSSLCTGTISYLNHQYFGKITVGTCGTTEGKLLVQDTIIPMSANTTYVISGFARIISDTYTTVVIEAPNFAYHEGGKATVFADTKNKVYRTGDPNRDPSKYGVEFLDNGWVHLWTSFTTLSTIPSNAISGVRFYLLPSIESSNNYVGDGVSQLYIAIPQVEVEITNWKGPTSPIVTTTTSVTRAADTFTLTSNAIENNVYPLTLLTEKDDSSTWYFDAKFVNPILMSNIGIGTIRRIALFNRMLSEKEKFLLENK